MRIVFFGIYEFGLMSLRSLTASGYPPLAVVTRPRQGEEAEPIVEFAREHGMEVLQPESPALGWFHDRLVELQPELNVVAGYHKLIPGSIIDAARHGTINLHGSLLPRYRGPSTWKQAIINGERETGVTVHVMTPKMDNGDILLQQAIPIDAEDTGGSLFRKICETGAAILPKAVEGIQRGTLVRVRQQEELASYYSYVTEAAAAMKWTATAPELLNLVRALNPRPGAWTTSVGRRYRIWKAEMAGSISGETPGRILSVDREGLLVATGSKDLRIREISAEAEETPATTGLLPRAGDHFDSVAATAPGVA